MSGVFITFEGGEGSGKSTQIARLAQRLLAAGRRIRVLREPGGTRLGEAVREVLLDASHEAVSPRCELLLYEAARAQLVDEVIRPALEAGEIVLCDRFFDSSTAYQGHARGLSLSEIDALNGFATGGLVPDRTLYFDISAEEGLRRATRGGAADRLEREDAAFHERVRAGFLAIAAASPERLRVVDATGTVEEVASRVDAELADLLAGEVPEGGA